MGLRYAIAYGDGAWGAKWLPIMCSPVSGAAAFWDPPRTYQIKATVTDALERTDISGRFQHPIVLAPNIWDTRIVLTFSGGSANGKTLTFMLTVFIEWVEELADRQWPTE